MAGNRVQKRSVMNRVRIYAFQANSASVFNFWMMVNSYTTCNTLYLETSCVRVKVRRNVLLICTIE